LDPLDEGELFASKVSHNVVLKTTALLLLLIANKSDEWLKKFGEGHIISVRESVLPSDTLFLGFPPQAAPQSVQPLRYITLELFRVA